MGNTPYKFNLKNGSRSRVKMIWSLLIMFVILICAYIGIFHSHRYYGFDMVLWLVIIGVLSIIVLDFIWFDHGKWQKLMSFLFVLIVGGPAAALVIFLHNFYINKQLLGHELAASGVVKELYVKKSKNSRTLYAVFSYHANGRTWTQNMINEDNPVKIGDTVKLLCSELDPDIFIRLKD